MAWVGLTATALLCGAVVAIHHEVSLRGQKSRELNALLSQDASDASAYIDSVFVSMKAILEKAKAVATIHKPDCRVYLEELKKSADFVGTIALIDANGVLTCPSAINSRVVLSGRDYFKRAMASDTFVVGGFIQGRVSGRYQLLTALSLTKPDGEKTGVIIATLDLAWLQQRLYERRSSAAITLTLADRNGVIIARYPAPARFVGAKIPAELSTNLKEDRPGIREYADGDGVTRVVAYVPISVPPEGIYVSSEASKSDGIRDVHGSSLSLFLATALAVFATVMIVRRAVLPRTD